MPLRHYSLGMLFVTIRIELRIAPPSDPPPARTVIETTGEEVPASRPSIAKTRTATVIEMPRRVA
jgi:hypothetical protein